ncbi:uncharacterized protein LOC112555711 [Pomacea canaliculata]|uniref:uncharacterized protein LOC112555711 n=1 Tax=Pomacea canaliculata TaxID=400727 RepID=UPI000D73EDB4|nr:uncharacterized protein LOC112555711 [Pomacea canaliculata]
MASGGLKDAPEVITVSDANTQFGLELFRKCGADRKDENLFLAPFSISTALAMTQLGAGGATAAEIAKALKWPSQERPLKGFGTYLSLMSSAAEVPKGNSYVLLGAQRIFVSQSMTLKQKFNSDAQKYFGADAKTADFQSNAEKERESINTWVSEKTQGKIKDLLAAGSLDSLTAMVLVQATYFKGFWLDKFDPRRTVKSYFKGTKGKVEVDMMSQETKFPYARCKRLSCSAVELPYARGDGSDHYDLSMLILLPDEDDGLAALEASLTASDLAKLRSSMTARDEVNLQLPRFSMESSLNLKEVLISLGMVNAFSKKNADFTGLMEQLSEDLYLSEVYHKPVLYLQEILLIFLCLLVMATGGLKDVPEVRAVSDANTQFGLELFRKCGADRKDENLFLAPFSISTALAMTQLGAGGATAAEMAKALKWPSQERPLKGFGSYLSLMSSDVKAHQRNSYVLFGAQRIFVRQPLTLKQQFNSDAQQYFGVDAKTADFQSNAETERENINTWVSEKTQGKIKDLLPAGSLDSLTAMVLVQATYFKGFWLDKFDPRRTVKSYFKGTKGKVEVDMMRQQAKFPYARFERLSCSAVELPYTRGDGSDRYDLSMLILLPDEDHGLAALEASLTASDLAKLRRSMTRSKVNLQLPRFSIESSLKLKEVLISLGMVNAFSEKNADFTCLVEQLSEDLYLSEVNHKAFVEVNEEGTEAAAATLAPEVRCYVPIIPFVVDHPFLFFIIDRRADIVLFMGRLVNPAHSKRAGNQEL